MRLPRSIHYVTDKDLVWKREPHGTGFVYRNRLGHGVREKDRKRIHSLRIPPAWTNVRICPDEHGHIQAIGFDVKGRKQFIYSPEWTTYTQQHKFNSLRDFAEVLPTLRETVSGHMRQHTLSRERVLATIVWLLEHTFIRVGNDEYAKENQSYGLTTMRTKHVDIDGNTVTFSFKGKSHVYHELDIHHPRVAQTIQQCIELPGYQLFKYLEEGKRQTIDSADVNEYLKSITGKPFTAKDFRTWGGTTLAGDTLFHLGLPEEENRIEKIIRQAIEEVASHLGNTVAVCRKYYVHPAIISSYERHQLIPHFAQIYKNGHPPQGLTLKEYATLGLIER